MHKKVLIVLIIIVLFIIAMVAFVISKTETEIVPEGEIENIDLRKTIISLYFQDKESKSLKIETRLIDAKDLLKNPYKTLIEMLIEGAENDMFETTIPMGTKVISTELKGNCLTINLSKEFLENTGDTVQKSNSLYQIINTVTELTEVNSVKFLIDGAESDGFIEDGISLKNEFVRMGT